MPSYIELDKNPIIPSATAEGKVILAVTTQGNLTITNNNGTTSPVSSVSLIPNMVTYADGELYGVNDPGFTVVDGLDDDDEAYSIPVEFPLEFLSGSYGNGDVWLISNSYLTFGPSGSDYQDYHPVGPGIVPIPAIYVGALDNSIQKYYYGYADGTDVFVIGYEGSNDTSGEQGQPAITWELQVSGSTPDNIKIVVGVTGGGDVPVNFPGGVWGISNGEEWVDRFQPLPWFSNYADNIYNSITIAPVTPQEADTLAFVGPGVTMGSSGSVTYVNIDPFDDAINVGYDTDTDQAVISSTYYGLRLTTAQDGEEIVIKPLGELLLQGGDRTANQPGDGRDVLIRGGSAAQNPTATASFNGGDVVIRGGQKTENGTPGQVSIVTDNNVGNTTWTFQNSGSTLFPSLTTPRGDTASGNLTSNTLKLGDGTNQAIISTPNGTSGNPNSQRLVINPGQGSGSSEGGDIYLWAGRGGVEGGSGGDIKVCGGYGPLSGSGGYVRIEGGDTTDGTAGFVEVKGGNSSTAAGGDVDIYGGFGNSNTQNGNVTINTYDSIGSIKTWVFDTSGSLTTPGNVTITGSAYAPNINGAITNLSAPGSGGVFNYDCSKGTTFVHFGVDATADWDVNLTNFDLPEGCSTSIKIITSNADTSGHTWKITGFKIDGVPQIWTKSWTNGARNTMYIYKFTIVNTVSGIVAYGERATTVPA
jgi:hypothetical protein